MNVLSWASQFLAQTVRALRLLSENWIIRAVNYTIVFFLLSSFGIIVWYWRWLPPQVPLYYSRPWGIEQLSSPGWLLLLPLGSLLWYVVNSLAAIYITHEYLVFTQILYLTSFITSLLSFVTLLKILFLVS